MALTSCFAISEQMCMNPAAKSEEKMFFIDCSLHLIALKNQNT